MVGGEGNFDLEGNLNFLYILTTVTSKEILKMFFNDVCYMLVTKTKISVQEIEGER